MNDEGFKIGPFWKIISSNEIPPEKEGEVLLKLTPGAGWGTGSHETTHLCLQAIGIMAPRGAAWRMLDFGSGSGVLAIGAAKLGATVEAIEIEEAAIINGRENVHSNGVTGQVRFNRELEKVSGTFDFVVANILRPVLMTFAEELASKLSANGTLVLSGLVATDVPDVGNRFSSFLKWRQPVVYKRGEWRALVWQTK